MSALPIQERDHRGNRWPVHLWRFYWQRRREAPHLSYLATFRWAKHQVHLYVWGYVPPPERKRSRHG